MSRIVFSNNKNIYEAIKNDYSKHFNISASFKEEHCYISTYKKLKKVTNNMEIFNNKDIIASSGTFFYKNSIGKEALNKLYEDIQDKGLNEIIKNITGNFCIILKKGTDIYFFVDNMGIYKLYYYINKSEITITNILYNLAKNIEKKITINEQSVLEDSFQFSILGEETFINEIKKVSANHIYKYNLSRSELVLIKKKLNTINYNYDDIDKSAEYLSSIIKNKIKLIKNNFDNITINMTGGLDSRLILSSFLSEGIKPNIIYGVGNSLLTDTKDRDLELNEIYAKKFNLKFFKMDWRTKEKYYEDWDYLLEKYGEYYVIYSGNRNIFEEYENNVSSFTDFIEFGYFGETFRNIEKLELSKTNFDLDYLIENLYLYNIENLSKFLVNEKDYRSRIKEKINKVIQFNDLNQYNIEQNDFQKIHSEYRKSADSKMSNLQNQIMYSFIILSDYEIQDFINNIPFQWKKDAQFMLKVIGQLEPETLKIPFFSHAIDLILNEKKLKLVPKKNHRIKKTIKKVIKNQKVYNTLKKIYNLFKTNRNVQTEFNNLKSQSVEKINDLQNELGIKLIYPDKYNGDIRSLMRYYQNLYMLKKIFKEHKDLED